MGGAGPYGINWLDVPGYTGAEPASGFAERLSQRDATAKAVTEGFIVGSARDVADAVGPYIEAGVNGVSFRVRFDGIDGRDVGRCIERIAAEVVPQLRRVHGGYRIDG